MYIREAVPEDNHDLQQLQAQCPQGTSLVVSVVNTPDFFARAKAYESYKVYVACEGNRIVGSAACAMRNALVNGRIRRVGYEFQYFTSPDYRQKGLAKRFRQEIEGYLTQHGAVLSYAIVMEGNSRPMRLLKQEGFRAHRELVMPSLLVLKEVDIPVAEKVRPVRPEDFAAVSTLLNETWQGRELYEPTSPESLARFIERTPGFSADNLFVLEDRGEVLACMGFWDWSRVMRVTVQALNLKMRLTGWLLVATRMVPRYLKPGDTLSQVMLTLIGFRDPALLATLVRFLNNEALPKGIEQIFCICERDDALWKSMKGFMHVDTTLHLYIKPFQENALPADGPVVINGIDL